MLKFDELTYTQEIQIFIDHMENSLARAWDEENEGNNAPIQKLYNSPIKISFNGASLELYVAPCEWESIIECLEKIKNESENY